MKPRRYIGGETHLYLGRQYRLKFRRSTTEAVKLQAGVLVVSSPHRMDYHRTKKLLTAWYHERARIKIVARFAKIAPRFAELGSG